VTQLQYNVGYMASELGVARQIDYTVAWTLNKYYLLTYLKTVEGITWSDCERHDDHGGQ